MDIILRVVAAVMVALLAACAQSDRTANGDPLMAEIYSIVGPEAKACGRVWLGTDPSEAWRCAELADSQGTPYWFAIQKQGMDAKLWSASLLTKSGERFILLYDPNYMGGPELMPSFTRRTCNGRIVLAPAYPEGLICAGHRGEP